MLMQLSPAWAGRRRPAHHPRQGLQLAKKALIDHGLHDPAGEIALQPVSGELLDCGCAAVSWGRIGQVVGVAQPLGFAMCPVHMDA